MDLFTFYRDKIITVFGGTGSIGSEIVSQLLKYDPKTIRIFSNSENELWESRLRFKDYEGKLRFLLGDIRNFERVKRAVDGIDYIFNAAAIKHVPIGEYNPIEAVSVNIFGLENIIEAAQLHNVKKVIHISTDKAVNPTTVMGATKLLSERLCIARERSKGIHKTAFSCVRFGNVIGSRGSIVPLIKEQIKKEEFVTLTDEKMRRFFLSISQAAKLVLKICLMAEGGEIFVLKMPNILIKDLIEVIIEEYAPKVGKNPDSIQIKTIGVRLGEKIDEELISPIEISTLYETDEMFIIYPQIYFDFDKSLELIVKNGIRPVKDSNFKYNTNKIPILTKDEIKRLLYDLKLL